MLRLVGPEQAVLCYHVLRGTGPGYALTQLSVWDRTRLCFATVCCALACQYSAMQVAFNSAIVVRALSRLQVATVQAACSFSCIASYA